MKATATRATLKALAPTLTHLERAVYQALETFHASTGLWPTIHELFRIMKDRREVADLDDLRPRLFYLHTKGFIKSSGRRTCAITRRQTTTWRVVQRRLL